MLCTPNSSFVIVYFIRKELNLCEILIFTGCTRQQMTSLQSRFFPFVLVWGARQGGVGIIFGNVLTELFLVDVAHFFIRGCFSKFYVSSFYINVKKYGR